MSDMDRNLEVQDLFSSKYHNLNEVLDDIEYDKRSCVIKKEDGSVVYEFHDAEVPKSWSQLAADIAISKYFRKSGIGPNNGPETSVKQLVSRVANAIAKFGKRNKYFADDKSYENFRKELGFILVNQYAAFNSPVWFNCGLHEAYGIKGSSVTSWSVYDEDGDPRTKTFKAKPCVDSYAKPQCSACFIQSVEDSIASIGDLAKKELIVFKYGSGCTSENSYVYLAGKGMIKIGKLFKKYKKQGRKIHKFDDNGSYIDVSDLDLKTLSANVKTGEYQLDKITKIWIYDVNKNDKLTIRLDDGTKVTVSAWHPFLVWDGEKLIERRADQLSRGDAVIGSNETAIKAIEKHQTCITYKTSFYGKEEENRIEINEDLAWLIGYFIGDGSLGKYTSHSYKTRDGVDFAYDRDGLRLRFHDETEECLNEAQRIIGKYFDETSSIQPDNGSNGKHITYTGRKVTNFFAALFEPGRKCYTVRIPKFIWESDRNIVLSFLAGLIDSDGYAVQGKAKYASASKKLIKEISILSSLYGLGGGVLQEDIMSITTILHATTPNEDKELLINKIVHPKRKINASDEHPDSRRLFCMPLSEGITNELFGDRKPSEWQRTQVGDQTIHLGRLHYEGIINPMKLLRCLKELNRGDKLSKTLTRIARSVSFVSEIDRCKDNPKFNDLTVEINNNYLAGETGLVLIHNSGSDFSKIRGKNEPLAGGGTSSGLMPYLEFLDKGAGSMKSGGTTRKSSTMRTLNIDHPDIIDFIEWKQKEERKAQALIAQGYPSDFNGEAYKTISGQNSNNSVRITDEFMHALMNDAEWSTIRRTDGKIASTYKAREIFDKIVDAAWSCGDPGIQFDTTIQKWHTSSNSGRIESSNPCSEYLFLNDTACNLASLNLTKFVKDENGQITFDVEAFVHVCKIIFLAQEILVDYSSYPTEAIAQNSHEYRPLGLGYANLGAMLMSLGIPYDSNDARSIAGAITALMTGSAYEMSAKIAEHIGSFKGYDKNQRPMLNVMDLHRAAIDRIQDVSSKKISKFFDPIKARAEREWDDAIEEGKDHGYRNAQASVCAPTGTIGFLMDCDTTGIEPDFAIVKHKKLAGGGHFKIINQSVPLALKNLGYNEQEVTDILTYILGTGKLPHDIIHDLVTDRRIFSEETISNIQKALPACFSIEQAFSKDNIGQELYERLGITIKKVIGRPLLAKLLELNEDRLQDLEYEILGRLTIEGAPHLKKEHYAVFDCANKCGHLGTRFIDPMAHVKMVAAAQPFFSGAISKTVNMPNSSTHDDVREVYMLAWRMGVKAVALYRDGCKASQPLSSSTTSTTDGVVIQEQKPIDVATFVRGLSKEHVVELQRILMDNQIAELVRVQHEGKLTPRRGREELPSKRRGVTYKLQVGEQKFWLRTGEYKDGRIGEIFIDVSKDGSMVRALMNQFAMSVSLGLQHGIPLDEYVRMFTFTSYEPGGIVRGHDRVKMCKSISDAIFRVLAVDYLHDDSYASIQITSDAPPPSQMLMETSGAQVIALENHLEQAGKTTTVSTTIIKTANYQQSSSTKMVGGAVVVDTPPCSECGSLTVRNGVCFRCPNCGTSLGCS